MNGLTHYDPFEEIRALQRQFFNEDLFGHNRKGMQLPTTDVYTEDDKQLTVEVHLPHFAEKDIDVQIDKGALVIRANRHEEEKDKKKKYVVRESSSSFYRRLQLPERADTENIKAEMRHGVLKVVVPFWELPEPTRIAIKSVNDKNK